MSAVTFAEHIVIFSWLPLFQALTAKTFCPVYLSSVFYGLVFFFYSLNSAVVFLWVFLFFTHFYLEGPELSITHNGEVLWVYDSSVLSFSILTHLF